MPRNNINPILYGFKFSTGDVNYLDYGATWVRQTGSREYHFINLINWEDSVSEREAKEIGDTYNLCLSAVDLDEIGDEQINRALNSCGWTRDDLPLRENATESDRDAILAECCHDYGLRAPLEDINTSNFHKTFRGLKGAFSVVATSDGVDAMASRWPCSHFPTYKGSKGSPGSTKPIRFDYEANGDLVGISTDYDGEDLLALSQDAQAFGKKVLAQRRAKAKAAEERIENEARYYP